MRKRMTALILATAMIATAAPAAHAAANNGFYRSTLANDWERGLYDACLKTWKSKKSYAVTYRPQGGASFATYETLKTVCRDVAWKAAKDHPEIFWVAYTQKPEVTGYSKRGGYLYSEAGKPITAKVTCAYDVISKRSLSDKFENALNVIRSKKDEALVRLQKKKPAAYRELLAINEAMMKYGIDYDTSKMSKNKKGWKYQNAYSAAVEHKAICVGYASLFKILCDESGIECLVVEGTGVNRDGTTESHGWNLVKLSGKWYIVDQSLNLNKDSKRTYGKLFLMGTDTVLSGRRIGSVLIPSSEHNYPTISKKAYGA